MKENEVPEKIWVHELSAKELNVPLKEYHIEYIRADAFIEKACDAYCKACSKPSYSVPIPFCRRRCESYNNFIKNIKL